MLDCASLQRLNLSHCKRLLQINVTQPLQRLRTLTLQGCHELHTISIRHLLSSPNLNAVNAEVWIPCKPPSSCLIFISLEGNDGIDFPSRCVCRAEECARSRRGAPHLSRWNWRARPLCRSSTSVGVTIWGEFRYASLHCRLSMREVAAPWRKFSCPPTAIWNRST